MAGLLPPAPHSFLTTEWAELYISLLEGVNEQDRAVSGVSESLQSGANLWLGETERTGFENTARLNQVSISDKVSYLPLRPPSSLATSPNTGHGITPAPSPTCSPSACVHLRTQRSSMQTLHLTPPIARVLSKKRLLRPPFPCLRSREQNIRTSSRNSQ